MESFVLEGDEEFPFLDDGCSYAILEAQVELSLNPQGLRVKNLDVLIFLDYYSAFWIFLTWRLVCDEVNIWASLQVVLMSDRKFKLCDLIPQIRLFNSGTEMILHF